MLISRVRAELINVNIFLLLIQHNTYCLYICIVFKPLNFQNMELNLKIEVFEILRHPAGTQKLLARNSFPIHSSVSFNYESLVDGIRLFYSNKPIIITFSIFSNER